LKGIKVEIEKIKKIAESMEIGLLERLAIGEIKDYSIALGNDSISIFMFKGCPIKEIPIKLSIKNDL
jgi:hypothetical protein